MSGDWEVFTKYWRKVDKREQDTPTVSLLKRGNLSLNEKARELLGSPSYVSLAYDRARCIIRIRGEDEHSPRSTPLLKGTGKHFVVSGIAFRKHFGINLDLSRRYVAQVQDGMLFITIDE